MMHNGAVIGSVSELRSIHSLHIRFASSYERAGCVYFVFGSSFWAGIGQHESSWYCCWSAFLKASRYD